VISLLTVGTALLLGLVASGHCILMCGGISTALGVVTAKGADGKSSKRLLIAYQCGRIGSYSIAGLILGGSLGGIVRLLNLNEVRFGLRALTATALLFAAAVLLSRWRPPGPPVGTRIWAVLAPLGRKLLPIRTVPRALAFGMIWGWMPCGLVYTVLLVATVQTDALRAAATMAAFGVGTAPAMLAMTVGGQRFKSLTAHPAAQRLGGALFCTCAALTLMGPWLVGQSIWLHRWLPLSCIAR
jgi:hypothetical protein